MSGGPLPVYFKLPISEISEIDDHKSVSKAGRDNLTRFSSNILNQIPCSFFKLKVSPSSKRNFKYGVRSQKFIWAPRALLYSLAETPKPPPPRIRAHIRRRYWSAKIDDISL